MKFSFLFAFDENYFNQGCVAIFSLLENLDFKTEIHVILDETNQDFKFPDKILFHKNLYSLKIKTLNVDDKFYNVDGSHVSKATFYRLYLSNIFKDEVDKLVYLDADIVCLNNPTTEINETFKQMENLNLNYGFLDELKKKQDAGPFIRLGMTKDKYFNAGVMLFSFQHWKENNMTNKALKLRNSLKEKAIFWDQDILNALIDGEYFSMSKNLNYKCSEHEREITNNLISEKNIKLLHYSGKGKPWEVGGIFEEAGKEYHLYYQELFNKKFHVISKNKKNSIKRLYKNKKNFRDLSILDLILYLYLSFKKIIF